MDPLNVRAGTRLVDVAYSALRKRPRSLMRDVWSIETTLSIPHQALHLPAEPYNNKQPLIRTGSQLRQHHFHSSRPYTSVYRSCEISKQAYKSASFGWLVIFELNYVNPMQSNLLCHCVYNVPDPSTSALRTTVAETLLPNFLFEKNGLLHRYRRQRQLRTNRFLCGQLHHSES